MDVIPAYDKEKYFQGVNLILECYLAGQCQYGGGVFSISNLKSAGDLLSKVFSSASRIGLTRAIRATVRTSTGLTADLATLGAGGDTIVNAAFAIVSSLQTSGKMANIINAFTQAKPLFKKLIVVDLNETVPIRSKLNLDSGFQYFEGTFMRLMNEYVQQYGISTLETAYKAITGVLGDIIKTVSDWIACLFPDTAGLAGEVARTVLNFVVLNGYTYLYNLISIMSDKMQRLITDTIGLKKFVAKAIKYLRDLLDNMDPKEFAAFAQAIGDAFSSVSDNPLWKGYMKLSTGMGKIYYSTIAKAYNAATKIPFVPEVNKWVVYLMDKFLIPYIGIGVDIFTQMLPVFLMFTLFVERYETIASLANNTSAE